MELSCIVKNNTKVNEMLSGYKKTSKSVANDLVRAINCLVETADFDKVIERIDKAYTVFKYMEPAEEDIIAILLHPLYGNGKIDYATFAEYFKESRPKRYYEWTAEAYNTAEKDPSLCSDEQTDYYVMLRVCDKKMDSIIRTMNKKGVEYTTKVFEAYTLAKQAYAQKRGRDGVPYLSRLVAVAGILAEVTDESTVVAAALLHQIEENTEYTVKHIKKKCGMLVAQYVLAVSSVHRMFRESHNRGRVAVDKGGLDGKWFEKLAEEIAADSKKIFALHIIAADKIYELRTMDKMPYEEKHEETERAELDFLPLFKRFGLNYFAERVEDLAWRANNVEYYEDLRAEYEELTERNGEHVEELRNILVSRANACWGYDLKKDKTEVSVSERFYLIKEVYGFVKEKVGTDRTVTAKDVNKKNVPICDFDIIVEKSSCNMEEFVGNFVKTFMDQIAPTGRVIIGFDKDKYGRFAVKIEDRHRSVFRLCFATREEYTSCKMGKKVTDTKGAYEEAVQPKDVIFVSLRNGKTISLPKGATVIDVAFAIHYEVGLAVKGATVNGHRVSIYNRVHDNDHIIVEADTFRKNGTTKQFISHARLGWLNYVVTEKAKKTLIRHLAERYEGDDPKDEYNALDSVAESIFDMLEATLKNSKAFEGID